jgi:hypothetical protein
MRIDREGVRGCVLSCVLRVTRGQGRGVDLTAKKRKPGAWRVVPVVSFSGKDMLS